MVNIVLAEDIACPPICICHHAGVRITGVLEAYGVSDFMAAEFPQFRCRHVVHVGDVKEYIPAITLAIEAAQIVISIAVSEAIVAFPPGCGLDPWCCLVVAVIEADVCVALAGAVIERIDFSA